MLDQLPPLREVMRHYDMLPHKKFGQNFILDLNITDRIARAAGDLHNVTVIEVGPGPGGLTRSLLQQGAQKVVALEIDRRCVHALQDYLVPAAAGRLQVVEADALTTPISQFAEGKPVKIIANLPYNVATPLLLSWFDQLDVIEGMTLMFQKEVADRITALPSTKAYGRLSVMAQWLCQVKSLFTLPPSAFIPPPKIYSSVVQLLAREMPLYPVEKNQLEHCCRIVFQQRRKMLRASLKAHHSDPEALLGKAGIHPTARPETLSIEALCRLAELLAID